MNFVKVLFCKPRSVSLTAPAVLLETGSEVRQANREKQKGRNKKSLIFLRINDLLVVNGHVSCFHFIIEAGFFQEFVNL